MKGLITATALLDSNAPVWRMDRPRNRLIVAFPWSLVVQLHPMTPTQRLLIGLRQRERRENTDHDTKEVKSITKAWATKSVKYN